MEILSHFVWSWSTIPPWPHGQDMDVIICYLCAWVVVYGRMTNVGTVLETLPLNHEYMAITISRDASCGCLIYFVGQVWWLDTPRCVWLFALWMLCTLYLTLLMIVLYPRWCHTVARCWKLEPSCWLAWRSVFCVPCFRAACSNDIISPFRACFCAWSWSLVIRGCYFD